MVLSMSSLDIQSEDDRYLLSFLNRTFFRGFEENRENWNVVEYFLGKTCNLDCKYCYLAKYGRELYPQKEKKEIIIENSKNYNVTFEQELARVIIHSLLHLMGYRDDKPRNKKQMTALQNFYLQQQDLKRLYRRRSKPLNG